MIILLLTLSVAQVGPPTADRVYAVDVFGNRNVSEADLRAAIDISPGDMTPDSLRRSQLRARLLAVTGVDNVDISLVCCSDDGRTVIYVGVREQGSPADTFRASPLGSERLPEPIVAAGSRYEGALISAAQRGAVSEDHSMGYALASDSALRSVQSEFIGYAERDFDTLVTVLRRSAVAEHRSLAALIIGYGADREAVSRELLYAMRDPDKDVRNNAVRGLAILARWSYLHPQAGITIPNEPFIALLNSMVWTDRNKGVAAMMSLTESRPSTVLNQLRERTLPSLIEMARWTYSGHALGPFLVLARVMGVDDVRAYEAWNSGDRESVIRLALDRQP